MTQVNKLPSLWSIENIATEIHRGGPGGYMYYGELGFYVATPKYTGQYGIVPFADFVKAFPAGTHLASPEQWAAVMYSPVPDYIHVFPENIQTEDPETVVKVTLLAFLTRQNNYKPLDAEDCITQTIVVLKLLRNGSTSTQGN